MQVDHSQAPCLRPGCACNVPEGDDYCSDQCRKAAQNAPSNDEKREEACACGHDGCTGKQ